jgi:hypothetical protein
MFLNGVGRYTHGAVAAVGAVTAGILLHACTSALERPGKPPKELKYGCEAIDGPMTPADSAKYQYAMTCRPYVEEVIRSAPPLGTCDELKAQAKRNLAGGQVKSGEFQATEELDVTILRYEEYYLSHRLHAAFDDYFDYTTFVDATEEREKTQIYIRVPKGYITDFTSVPRGPPQAFFRTFARHVFPAIAHDFLYAVGPEPGSIRDPSLEGLESWYSRKYADEVLQSGMIRNNSDPQSYQTVTLAVRLFGVKGFGNKTELRFLVKRPEAGSDGALAPAGPRVVSPTQDYVRTGYVQLRSRYVRICSPSDSDGHSFPVGGQ